MFIDLDILIFTNVEDVVIHAIDLVAWFSVGNEVQSKWQVPVSTWTNPNTDEDWDEGQYY